MCEVSRKGDFVERLEVHIVYVQGPHFPERSKVDDVLFEDLGSDAPSTELECSDERGNTGGRRRDYSAPALKTRLVPEGDVLEEDQLASNPP